MRQVSQLMQVILIMAAIAFTAWYFGYTTGEGRGRQQALKTALSTNPVSEELELVCAGLWVGEQNKKYWEKENGSRLPRNGYAISNGK